MVEQRFLLALAYQHGQDERIAKGVDGHRDFFTEAELEKAAWSLLQQGGLPEVGMYHVDGTVGHARIVESYIWRGEPFDMAAVDGTTVRVNKGDWLVGLLCDEVAWGLYKAGKVGGVSMQGVAKRRPA